MAPINKAALLPGQNQPFTLTERPIPTPQPNQLVIRSHAIAINPADWIMMRSGLFIKDYPTVLGSDTAGTVHSIGSAVTKYKVGDRVAGFGNIIPSANPDTGAFQNFMVTFEAYTVRLPDSMSFREGSMLPMGVFTASIGIFKHLAVPQPTSTDVPDRAKTGILVWGAASSVGSSALQLARNTGYTVYVTASAQHHSYLKSLGAAEAFDYKDPDVVTKILEVSNKQAPISLILDAISTKATLPSVVDILRGSSAPQAEKRLTYTFHWPQDLDKPKDGEFVYEWVEFAKFDLIEYGNWFWNQWLQDALERKAFVPSPNIQLLDGGLEGAYAACQTLEKGVSGVKLVLDIE